MSNFDTYAEFLDTTYEWLDCTSADISASLMGTMADIGQNRVERGGSLLIGGREIYIPGVRVRENEKALSVAAAGGVFAVPSDYLELKQAYFTTGGVKGKLTRVELDFLYHEYAVESQTGTPVYIARDGNNFVFGPPATSGTLLGAYYRSFPKISGVAGTITDSVGADYNALYTAYPELYMFATLMEAEPLLRRESRSEMWGQKYASIAQSLQTKDERERFSGSPLQIRAS